MEAEDKQLPYQQSRQGGADNNENLRTNAVSEQMPPLPPPNYSDDAGMEINAESKRSLVRNELGVYNVGSYGGGTIVGSGLHQNPVMQQQSLNVIRKPEQHMPPLPPPNYSDSGIQPARDRKRNLAINEYASVARQNQKLHQNPVTRTPQQRLNSREPQWASKTGRQSAELGIKQASERRNSPIPPLEQISSLGKAMYPMTHLEKGTYAIPQLKIQAKQNQLPPLPKPLEQDQMQPFYAPSQKQHLRHDLVTNLNPNKGSMAERNSLDFSHSALGKKKVVNGAAAATYAQGFSRVSSSGTNLRNASKEHQSLIDEKKQNRSILVQQKKQEKLIRNASKRHNVYVGDMSGNSISYSNLKGVQNDINQQEQRRKRPAGPLHHNTHSQHPYQHTQTDGGSRSQISRQIYSHAHHAYEQGSYASALTSRALSGTIQTPLPSSNEHRKAIRASSVLNSVSPINPNGSLSAHDMSTVSQKLNPVSSSIESSPITPPPPISSSKEKNGQKNSRSSHKLRKSDSKPRKPRTKFYKLATSLNSEFEECWKMLKKLTTPRKGADDSEKQVLSALFSGPDVSSHSNLESVNNTMLKVAYNQNDVRNDAGLKESLNHEFESLTQVGTLCLSKITHYHGRISILDSDYKKVFLMNVASGLKEVTVKIQRIKKRIVEILSDIDRLIKVNLKREESTETSMIHGKQSPLLGREVPEGTITTQQHSQSLQSGSGRKRKRTAKFVDNIEDEVTKRKNEAKKMEEIEPIVEENSAGRQFKKAFIAQSRRLAKRANISIDDQSPNRTTNPLLEIAKYPQTSANETLPHGTEFWKMISIYFPKSNTFPVSYFARILGFDVPAIAQITGPTSKKFDPKIMTLKRASEAMTVPRLGNFAPYLLDDSKVSLPYDDNVVRNMNEVLDYVDPMWKAIQKQYRGYNEQMFKAATEMNHTNIISEECIKYATRLGLLGDEMNFRAAEASDAKTLFQINTVSRQKTKK